MIYNPSMKKLFLLLLLSLSFIGSTNAEVELDFSSGIFCDKSPKVQARHGLFWESAIGV